MIQSTKSIMVFLIVVLGFAGCGENLTSQSGTALNDGIVIDATDSDEVEEAALAVTDELAFRNPSFVSMNVNGRVLGATFPTGITTRAQVIALMQSNQLNFQPIETFFASSGAGFGGNSGLVLQTVSSYQAPTTTIFQQTDVSGVVPTVRLGRRGTGSTCGNGASILGSRTLCNSNGVLNVGRIRSRLRSLSTNLNSVFVAGLGVRPFRVVPVARPVQSLFLSAGSSPLLSTILNTCGGATLLSDGTCVQPVIVPATTTTTTVTTTTTTTSVPLAVRTVCEVPYGGSTGVVTVSF